MMNPYAKLVLKRITTSEITLAEDS